MAGPLTQTAQQQDPSLLDSAGNLLSNVVGTAKNINGALSSPDFWELARDNAAQFMTPNDTPTTLGLPSREDMEKMGWPTLYNLRLQKGLSEQDQNYLAPYEHQAYAREQSDNPYHALQQAVLTLGYTPYKALGIGGKSRSQPSLNEIAGGLRGAWQGLTR